MPTSRVSSADLGSVFMRGHTRWKKLLTFFLVVGVWLSGIHTAPAQGTHQSLQITEVFEGEPLLDVIKHMQRKYQLKIAYERRLVRPYKVRVALQQMSLEESWRAILAETPLTFMLLGNGRVVIRRAPTFQDPGRTASLPEYTYAAIVKDQETGERIPYASISLAGTSQGVVANQDGFFSLSYAPSIQDSLVISHLGYAPTIIPVDQSNAKGEIDLRPTISVLNEVEISENPSIGLTTFSAKSGQSIVNPTAVGRLPQLGEKDIFRSLQFLPGISMANETAAKLGIRGSTPDQNLVLYDGFTIYHLDHLYGFFSSINADAIKDVRIYKGGFDAKYGGRTSGIIDITGKSGNQNSPSASVGVNLLSMNLQTETPLGENGSAFVALRRSYTDLLQSGQFNTLIAYANNDLPPLLPGISRFTPDEEESFYYHDAHVKLNYRPSSQDQVSLSFYQGGDDYSNHSSLQLRATDINLLDDRQETHQLGNTGVGVRWNRIWSDRLFSTSSFGYSHYYTNYEFTVNSQEDDVVNQQNVFSLERENRLEEYTSKLDFEYHLHPDHQLDFGLFSTFNETVFTDQNSLSETTSTFQNQGWQNGFYLQHNFSPLDQLTITSGLRNTHYSVTNQLYFEPRLSVSYELPSGLTLNGATGQYYQFINQAQADLGLNFDQDYWFLSGNGDGSLLSSQHYIGGLRYGKNSWVLEAEVYRKYTEGLTQGNFESYVNSNSTQPYWNFNRLISGGKSIVNGLDAMITKAGKNYTATVSYSLSSSIQQFEELNGGEAFYADEDQRHEFTFLSQWEWQPWTFSLNWMYGSGQPYSAPSTLDTENGRTRLVYSERNSNRLPAYHRMDISAGYQFRIGQGQAKVGASVFNLYNHQNIGDRAFILDRLGVYQRSRRASAVQLVPVDQLLLGRTFSLFFNIKF
ncbi:MAG: TonB-dependent receptor [Bacteroidota bacterium]